jgi:methylthioribulose-1-phosphate dehydratase
MSIQVSPPIAASREFADVSAELAETVRYLSAKGWTPATSSNFSVRIPEHDDAIAISKSGIDKAFFSTADVMIVDGRGERVWPDGVRSSAETPLHIAIYDLFGASAVLHTHSMNATVASLLFGKAGGLAFAGLELLKGFRGITTHETSVDVPIFPNDQDMERLSGVVRHELRGKDVRGFLIEGHGLYSWGQTIGEARRHLEVFEFLFELQLRMEGLHGSPHYS